MMTTRSAEALRVEEFSGRIGQEFSIGVEGGGSFRARLAEAATLRLEAGGGERPPFQLQFHSAEHSAAAFWPQRIYTVEHAELGRMEIFLVPIGPARDGGGGFRYQAVFH
jgi:hypothetical protein